MTSYYLLAEVAGAAVAATATAEADFVACEPEGLMPASCKAYTATHNAHKMQASTRGPSIRLLLNGTTVTVSTLLAKLCPVAVMSFSRWRHHVKLHHVYSSC